MSSSSSSSFGDAFVVVSFFSRCDDRHNTNNGEKNWKKEEREALSDAPHFWRLHSPSLSLSRKHHGFGTTTTTTTTRVRIAISNIIIIIIMGKTSAKRRSSR